MTLVLTRMLLWVELCPPETYDNVPTPSSCERDSLELVSLQV